MSDEKLLLIPGPSPVVPRVLDALALPTVSHVGPEMAHDLKEACENLKKIVFCQDGEPFVIAGAGTLSMEMALLNTAGPGDRILVPCVLARTAAYRGGTVTWDEMLDLNTKLDANLKI